VQWALLSEKLAWLIKYFEVFVNLISKTVVIQTECFQIANMRMR
jgi:hypothetical protein